MLGSTPWWAEGAAGAWDGWFQRAGDLLKSERMRQALDLDDEPAATRDCYGRSRFGEALLLTQRLLEAGVPFLTVNWARQNGDQWDTHKASYPRLRQLLPPFDQGLAAFLDDLDVRGLLAATLVYCLGGFGRTPKMNADGGRDQWPACYSVLLAGGGVRRGTVLGASDRMAAAVVEWPVAPWDLAATVYHALGIDPQTHLLDPLGWPLAASSGEVVPDLLT